MRDARPKNVALFGILIVCAIISFGLRGPAQDNKLITTQELNAILKDFKDPSWEKRCQAFSQLLYNDSCVNAEGSYTSNPFIRASVFTAHPDRENELKLALIDLLSMENPKVQAEDGKFQKGEKRNTLPLAYGNYYGALIVAVAGLKDSRAAETLVGAMSGGGTPSNYAAGALAEFGAVSLDPVLHGLQNRYSSVRVGVVHALDVFLLPKYRDKFSGTASQQRIKAALLKAAADEDGSMRTAAVTGLALIPDADTLAVLKKIADSDPLKFPGQSFDGVGPYPIRYTAKKALDEIGRQRDSAPNKPK